MAVTAHAFGLGMRYALSDTSIDWDSDTIKVALLKNTYTPDWDGNGHDAWDDISTHEVSGTGYTAGGKTLTSCTTSCTTSAPIIVTFDAADVSWTSSTITARYAVIYKSTGTASTSPLIAYVDFGEDKVSESGTFSITWASDGILKLTLS